MDAMGNQERKSNGSGQNLKKYLTTVIFMKQKIHYGLVTKSKQSKMCIKLPTHKYEGDNLM